VLSSTRPKAAMDLHRGAGRWMVSEHISLRNISRILSYTVMQFQLSDL